MKEQQSALAAASPSNLGAPAATRLSAGQGHMFPVRVKNIWK